jgi:hypothetical protein
MGNINILIVVLSYTDNNGVYDMFYESQKKTWDSIVVDGVKTLYNYGNYNTSHIIGDKINVTTKEDLWNCGYKTLESFELILNSGIQFDYIFRTNSSSYVDKQKLKDFLSDKPRNGYYAGHSDWDQNINYVSGSGIILSNDLVRILVSKKNKFTSNLMDDANIGYILNSSNFFPKQVDRCNYHNYVINNLNCDNFLYRLRSDNRNVDLQNMYNIFKLKNNKI